MTTTEQIFEIHITGNIKILDVARKLDLKTITINLCKPDYTQYRKEFMTSIVKKFPNYILCKDYVDTIVAALKANDVLIFRVKMESPYYEEYVEMSKYIESHFNATNNMFPLSKNEKKDTYLATDRRYTKAIYKDFIDQYKNEVVELCLLDDNITEDLDWFELYK